MSDKWYFRIFGVLVLLLFSAATCVLLVRSFRADFSYFVGMAFSLVGITIWCMGLLSLREALSVLPRARALVTTGIYSRGN